MGRPHITIARGEEKVEEEIDEAVDDDDVVEAPAKIACSEAVDNIAKQKVYNVCSTDWQC